MSNNMPQMISPEFQSHSIKSEDICCDWVMENQVPRACCQGLPWWKNCPEFRDKFGTKSPKWQIFWGFSGIFGRNLDISQKIGTNSGHIWENWDKFGTYLKKFIKFSNIYIFLNFGTKFGTFPQKSRISGQIRDVSQKIPNSGQNPENRDKGRPCLLPNPNFFSSELWVS